jgi:rubrerythrin
VDQSIIERLHDARRAEKEQALFYRALASRAEDDEDAQLAEDLNGLHADEQHHLSRITVRLVELDEVLRDLGDVTAPDGGYPDWKPRAREREQQEVERYRGFLERDLDAATRALMEEILTAEEHHAGALAGKYMNA